jgi:hypothetical protein
VIGVFKASSCRRRLGEATIGLLNSDGNVPDAGVCKEEAALELERLLKPAAAMVAVAVAEAIMVGGLLDR